MKVTELLSFLVYINCAYCKYVEGNSITTWQKGIEATFRRKDTPSYFNCHFKY